MNIQDIIQSAKDTILKHGEHGPVLYVELVGQEKLNIIILPPLSGGSNAQRFFAIGRSFGLSNLDCEVSQLALVLEAIGEISALNNPHMIESTKEALIINTLTVADKKVKQDVHIIEIIRDNEGNLMDLFHDKDDDKKEDVLSLPLTTFLGGFCSSSAEDSEIEKMAHDAMVKEGLNDRASHLFLDLTLENILHPRMQMMKFPLKQRRVKKKRRREKR